MPRRRLSLRPSLFRTILTSWWGGLGVVVAFVLTVLQVDDAYLHTIPEIHPAGPSSEASRYSLPFSLTNPSPQFAMTGIVLQCEYSILTRDRQSSTPHHSEANLFRVIGQIQTTSMQDELMIDPGGVATFSCDAAAAAPALDSGETVPITEIHVRVRVSYHIKGPFFKYPRHNDSPLFVWRMGASGLKWDGIKSSDNG